MFPKKIWISIAQTIGLVVATFYIARLIINPDTSQHIGEPKEVVIAKNATVTTFFAVIIPACIAGSILLQWIFSRFKLMQQPSRVAIYIVIGGLLLSLIWLYLFQPNLLKPSTWQPAIGLGFRIGLSFVVSIVLIRLLFPSLFNSLDYDAHREVEIDDTPAENTKEFDKQVMDGRLTVIPTLDRDIYVLQTHGSAAFIPDKIKEKSSVKNPQKGLWLGGGYFHHKEGNLLTVAAPGSGKGAGLIIPNLLVDRDYPHSFVVFDPKGTNAAITARYQQQRGQKIVILDPANIQELNGATHGIRSACFNPLDFIGQNLVRGCGIIANLLLPDDPKASEKIWASEARDLIQGVLIHIMTSSRYEDQRNLVTLYKLFRQKTWDDILAEMVQNSSCDGRVIESAKKLIDLKETNERGFGSVVFSTGEAINWLKDPDLQDSLKRSDFNPADFDKGGVTMYLCIPIDSVELYATWGRLVIGLLVQANARPSGREKAWCYYLLDEFPTMGVFPEVIKALAFSREFKMRLWLFAQNLAQLDRIYSDNQRKEILGTCGVFQAFAVNEPTTANYVSEKLGAKTQLKISTSHSQNTSSTVTGSSGSSISSSQEEFQRPLLFANEVEQEKNIITFSEIGVFRLARWLYWKQPTNSLEAKYHKMMIERADKNINYS
jgi:type IV secretion system protein VirD4